MSSNQSMNQSTIHATGCALFKSQQQSSELIEHQVREQVLVEEDLVGATGQS